MNENERDELPVDVPSAEAGQAVEQNTEQPEAPETEAAEATEQEQATEQEAQTGEEDDGEGDEEGKRKRPSHAQRLRRRLHTTVDQLNSALRELDDLKQRQEAAAKAPKQPEQTEEREPTETDFNGDWTRYVEARAAWVGRQEARKEAESRFNRLQEEESQRRANEAMARRSHELQQAEEDARVRIPDFDEVVSDLRPDQLSPTVRKLLWESEKPADLAYELGKDPQLVRKLNTMSEREALREVIKIEERAGTPRTPKITKAPAPIKPPTGGGASPPADPYALSKDEDATAVIRMWEQQGKGARA